MTLTEQATEDSTYRDRKGNELTYGQWLKHMDDRAYRIVAHDKYLDARVRTLWEGTDDGLQVACQYHTGIYWGGTWKTVWEGHWPCTEQEAKKVHRAILKTLRETCPKRPETAT